MTANRDAMSTALVAVYGPDNNLADWEAQHWVAEGFEPCGPGDKAAWYAAEGASGSSYGDLEYDYWTNVYAGGGGTPPSNTVAPLLSGSTAALGNSVSTGNGTWTGDATITFTYQWQVSATGVGGWSNIASLSTSSSFTITASEQGQYIRCVVTGTNGAGNSSANSDVCAVESAGLTLLKSATLWLSASAGTAGEQTAVNQGTGGSALNARYGSTASVDSNDPLLLTHSGTNYLYLPGIAGNYASSPDSAALSITGDIDIRIDVALSSYASGSNQGLVAKYSGSGGYIVVLDTTGALAFYYNAAAGGTQATAVELGLTNGTRYELRVTVDVDDGAGNKVISVYKRAGGTNDAWTLVKSNTTAGTISITDTADALAIGSDRTAGTSSMAIGSFYKVQIYSGIAGTKVFDADFTANTNQSSFTESSSNAATVTINRATSGRKSVMVVRPVWLFGTDDYLEVADNDLLDFASSDNFTLLAVVRQFSDTAYGYVMEKRATALTDRFRGYEMNVTATDVRGFVFGATLDGDIDGSKGTAATKAYTLGSLTCMTVVRDTGADQLKAGAGSSFGTAVTDASVNGLANSSTLRVGVSGSAGYYYMNGEISHVAIFRSALTTTDIGNIMSYLGVS